MHPPSSGPSGSLVPYVLEATGLCRRFGDQVAVWELDLAVVRGEYFCIVGPSGSGKSTLLRMLAGFERPEAGEIRLAGVQVDGLPPERRDLNTVFQGYALFPHLTVEENVQFGLRMKGVAPGDRRRRASEALDLVGLAGYGPRKPATLSGGEQQRVALARAVVNRPAVLLLDEPLAALDRKLRLRMQDELLRIQRDVGITFLHITHDQQEALRLADRLAVMRRGRFLQVGPPSHVYHRPSTPFVADFVGNANLLEGIRLEGLPPRVRVEEGVVLELPANPELPDGFRLPAPGERVELAIRPEAIGLARLEEGAGPGGGGNRIQGRLERRQALGGVEELTVQVGLLRLEVHVAAARSRSLPQPGEPVTLTLAPEDLVPLAPDGTGLQEGRGEGHASAGIRTRR
jgi:ABC-type Fe3+/spermidine/putrescine transport system ATPase subunit